MEYFISQSQIVLPLLGINIFRLTPTAAPASVQSDHQATVSSSSPIFEMVLKRNKVTARAQEIDGEFTVLEASEAVSAWIGASYHSYRALREKLENDGTLVAASTGSLFVFTHDQVFASPRAAAAMVAGRAANGRVEWRVEGTAVTYGGWQEKALEVQLGHG
jgi:hypothetical protein